MQNMVNEMEKEEDEEGGRDTERGPFHSSQHFRGDSQTEAKMTIRVRYCLTLATGVLECLCFCGLMFGWASLVFILKTEGFFRCQGVNTTEVNTTQEEDCNGQDDNFSLVFTVASSVNSFVGLPTGFLFDHFGTLVTRLCAIFCYTFGTLLFAFANPALSMLLYPALPLLAVGGVMFLISNIQVANLFGSRRSTVITVHNGAFDSSSAIFFFIKLIYESGISLRSSFLFLSACSIIHLLRTLFLMPRKLIPYPLPDGYTYGITSTKSKATGQTINTESPVKQEKSFRECFLSWFFLWHLVWLSVMQLRHYFFIGTLDPMLQHLTDGEPSLVSQYINAFAITQLCGLFCAPWNGLLMDRHKRKPLAAGQSEHDADLQASALPLFLTALQCLLFSICATIPVLPLQYFTFVVQVINRSFLFSGHAAFISVAFPSCHFGKLYGLVLALAALFSLLQYLCFTLVKDVLNGDPLYVNIGLTVLGLLAFIHPIFIYFHCRRRAKQRASS